MKLKAISLGAAGLLLCLGQATQAQVKKVAVGTISATIDGAAYEGQTLDVPSEGTSTAEVRDMGPVKLLYLQSHDPEAATALHNVFSVEFGLMGEDASASLMEVSVSWWPEGMDAPFYVSEGSGTDVNIVVETLSLKDGASRISGNFSAQLCRKESFFAETDTGDCLPVEGRFDSALHTAD